MAKYDRIGKTYNSTRKADPFLKSRLIEHLSPSPAGLYLDIGCGTGNYTCALADEGISLIGVDPSEEMLSKARVRNPEVDWRKGVVEDLPLDTGSVDGVIAFLTTHHWADLNKGFAELARVMKPGGTIVIFTSTPQQMQGYWLNHYFPKMLSDSMAQMPSFEATSEAMQRAGIEAIKQEKYFIRPDLQDMFLNSGKNDPKLYLDERIRAGISSFAALSNRDEVEKGLTQLEKDIASGEVREIINSYEDDLGDYMWVIGRK